MKRVLFVAYHFPPQTGSSGLLRSLKFCRYLPESGWHPTVLTVRPSAYERLDPSQSQLKEIPANVTVHRVFAVDTARHLSIRGRYPKALALPDRWVSWVLGGVPRGVWTIWREKTDVLFTTFPIASAILIGWILHRVTGKPWVVDFRDSMTEDDYPRDPMTRRVYRWIEERAIREGSLFLFTAATTIAMYLQRYPFLKREACVLLPNGYDEEDFNCIDWPDQNGPGGQGPVRLLHTGLVYPEERDPRPFFRALARLKQQGRVNSLTLRVELRATGEDDYFQKIIQDFGLSELVHLAPALPYHQSLQDGANADALLIFQGVTCAHQIPAKPYEFLRLGKPILALTTHAGDTAELLRKVGGATILNMYDEQEIAAGLVSFLQTLREGSHPLPDRAETARYARRNQARQLAHILSSHFP